MNESEKRSLPRTSSSNSISQKPDAHKLSLPLKISHQDSVSNLSQTQQISELEWDKELDFVCKAESDTLSAYDLNERIQELLKQRILDFEMLSITESVKNLSSIDEPENEFENSDISSCIKQSMSWFNALEISPIDYPSAANLLTPVHCLTSDDIFTMKFFNKQSSRICSPLEEYKSLLYSPITFDLESNISYVNKDNVDQISNSMPDLRSRKNKDDKIRMMCKHKSLLELSNFNCTYVKRPESFGIKESGTRFSYSLPRMSRLQTIKCYINRLSEKVRTIIKETFTNRRKSASKASQLYSIREESYDIIELDASILKQ